MSDMRKCIQNNDNDFIVVIDQDETLISRLSGYAIVSRISDLEEIERVERSIHTPTKLHCVVFEDRYCSLSSLEFKKEWEGIPLHLFIGSIGDFFAFSEKIKMLRQLSIRIFLYADHLQSITDVRILSSLGIYTGLVLPQDFTFWDELDDLISYAIYGRANHAPIEPFGYFCSNYNNSICLDPREVYFNSPKKFIHVDVNENIALNREDLLNKKFVAHGVENIAGLRMNEAFLENAHAWQNYFLLENGCAYCPAWRICQGYFDSSDNQMCRDININLLEAVELFRNNLSLVNNKKLCQL